jgi:hypothetical protein
MENIVMEMIEILAEVEGMWSRGVCRCSRMSVHKQRLDMGTELP